MMITNDKLAKLAYEVVREYKTMAKHKITLAPWDKLSDSEKMRLFEDVSDILKGRAKQDGTTGDNLFTSVVKAAALL